MRVSRQQLANVQRDCFCLALKRAARVVARRYDDALRDIELNSGQFSLMALVEGTGPVAVGRLGELLGMDRTTVTAALKPLQRRKLLRVAAPKTDARSREVVLTAAGQALLERALPFWAAEQSRFVRDVLPGDAARLRSVLAEVH